MDIPTEVRRLNPWWDDPSAVDNDEYITEWAPMGYTPGALGGVMGNSGSGVYVLRGMRRVGKTTLMKVTIKRLLESGVQPRRILYYDSGVPEKVREAVDYHTDVITDSVTGHHYLFLDGAASMPKWAEHVGDMLKVARDPVIVVSGYADEMVNAADVGSRIPDFRRIGPVPARESIPERLDVQRGDETTLMPMSFREAATRIDPEIGELVRNNDTFSPLSRQEIFGNLIAHEMDERLEELSGYKSRLDKVLDTYLATGGMPHAVYEYMRRGLSWDPVYDKHIDALSEAWGNIPRRDPDLFVRFGCWLAGYDESLVSWDKLARGTGITPPQMVLNYANLLERFFVLHILYRHRNGRPDTGSAKKIFFTDPTYLHMFRYLSDPQALPAPLYVPDNRDKVLSGVVATHLIRLARAAIARDDFDPRRSVFYWMDKKSRPVDFVMDLGDDIRVPLKVQMGHVNRRDMAALTRFLNQTDYGGLLLGQGDLDVHRDYIVVPASIFLMLA